MNILELELLSDDIHKTEAFYSRRKQGLVSNR